MIKSILFLDILIFGQVLEVKAQVPDESSSRGLHQLETRFGQDNSLLSDNGSSFRYYERGSDSSEINNKFVDHEIFEVQSLSFPFVLGESDLYRSQVIDPSLTLKLLDPRSNTKFVGETHPVQVPQVVVPRPDLDLPQPVPNIVVKNSVYFCNSGANDLYLAFAYQSFSGPVKYSGWTKIPAANAELAPRANEECKAIGSFPILGFSLFYHVHGTAPEDGLPGCVVYSDSYKDLGHDDCLSKGAVVKFTAVQQNRIRLPE